MSGELFGCRYRGKKLCISEPGMVVVIVIGVDAELDFVVFDAVESEAS